MRLENTHVHITDGQDSTGNGLERMVDRLLQPQLDNFQFTAIIVGSEGDMAQVSTQCTKIIQQMFKPKTLALLELPLLLQGKKILDLMNARWNPKCVTKMNVIAGNMPSILLRF
jgi:hypothetical protein